MFSLKGSLWLFTVTGGKKSPAIYFLWRNSYFLNIIHLILSLSLSLSALTHDVNLMDLKQPVSFNVC